MRFMCMCYISDSVTSWVEVMLTNGKWKSLHIPSVSVGQPVLCEKHANTKLLYVLGYEHCKWRNNTVVCVHAL